MEGNAVVLSPTIYVIDTSALIQLDFLFPKANPVFTAIWEEMEEMATAQTLHTIDYVEVEIEKYQGKETFLKKWMKQRRKVLVHPTTEECYLASIPIINAEYNTGFLDAKKLASGEEEADPYLIAYAQVFGCTLVTNESPVKPNKIPQVAARHGVRCISVYTFIQERGLIMIRGRQ